MHIKINREASARTHKYMEQYIAIDESCDEIVCSKKYLLCLFSLAHIMELTTYKKQ